ncbi:peptidase C1 [Thermococcus sp. 21S7]|nr:peptidase C1 [Thermococcus sp. 21S7]
MLNWWRNNPYPSSFDVIMNPTFTYNLINGGYDDGSIPYDAMNLISTVGAVPYNEFPVYTGGPGVDPDNYAWVWPNLSQWMMAPHNSADSYTYLGGHYINVPGDWYVIDLSNDTQWEYLKGLLASGYVVQFAYPVNLVFYIATDMDASSFLRWLNTLANRTGNQTFVEYVKEHFTENQTFVQEANYYFSYDKYTITNSMVDWAFDTWFDVWEKYYKIKYNKTAPFVFGGHAVTIVGYDDSKQTTDGNGVLIIANSWGSDWGDHGYFYISYDAARFGSAYRNSNGRAWVYVPKAADYTPSLMAVVGIEHPIRGETFDGVTIFDDNASAGYPVLAVPKRTGLPVGVMVDGENYYIPFMDFMINEFWFPIQLLPQGFNYTNYTLLSQYLVAFTRAYAQQKNMTYEEALEDLWYPHAHPYPDSPMAFDVTDLLDYIRYLVSNSDVAPMYATFYVNVSDGLPDDIAGDVYNFTLLININNHYVPIASLNQTISIPDGGNTLVALRVPVVKYENAPTNVTVNYGSFDVSVFSLVPLQNATVVIDDKSYPLSAEDGGYYYYATGIAQKLKLPAGTYNYTVVVTYPNGKEVTLPQRTVTIKEPVVYIQSPEPNVYNTSEITVSVKVVDALNVENVTAEVNGREYSLTYNATLGLYTGILNLTNGSYTMTVTAVDEEGNSGVATVHFVIHTEAKIEEISVNNETNVTVGVVGGSADVSVKDGTIVADVATSEGSVQVEVPVVNNAPSVMVNVTAVNKVASGESNVSLVAGWNTSVEVFEPEEEFVKTEDNKKIYSVTLRANVSLGENGVAVIALRDINISKVYVLKNGQKIQLTTDRDNPLGYYYVQNGIVFVVLKQDPVIEADGTKVVPVPRQEQGISLAALNFLGYRWYHMYREQFEELYNKSLELNISNETLAEALKLHNEAAEYYKQVLDLIGSDNVFDHLMDIRILSPLRKAYLAEIKAVKLLKEAIEEAEGS